MLGAGIFMFLILGLVLFWSGVLERTIVGLSIVVGECFLLEGWVEVEDGWPLYSLQTMLSYLIYTIT
jgi:hypothetical protein